MHTLRVSASSILLAVIAVALPIRLYAEPDHPPTSRLLPAVESLSDTDRVFNRMRYVPPEEFTDPIYPPSDPRSRIIGVWVVAGTTDVRVFWPDGRYGNRETDHVLDWASTERSISIHGRGGTRDHAYALRKGALYCDGKNSRGYLGRTTSVGLNRLSLPGGNSCSRRPTSRR